MGKPLLRRWEKTKDHVERTIRGVLKQKQEDVTDWIQRMLSTMSPWLLCWSRSCVRAGPAGVRMQ